MSWFQLDPESIAARARESGEKAPSLAASLARGMIGFTLVGILGFSPWAVGGMWLYNTLGEFWVYTFCALVFILTSGLALHRLIIGPGSLARFYKVFAVTFSVFAATWIFCWMMIAGEIGCFIGLLAGTIFMGALLALAFDAERATFPVIVSLSALNLLGYYGGGWVEGLVTRNHAFTLFLTSLGISRPSMVAQLLWGACYGIGFGAGIGLAFYLCQAQARALLQRGE